MSIYQPTFLPPLKLTKENTAIVQREILEKEFIDPDSLNTLVIGKMKLEGEDSNSFFQRIDRPEAPFIVGNPRARISLWVDPEDSENYNKMFCVFSKVVIDGEKNMSLVPYGLACGEDTKALFCYLYDDFGGLETSVILSRKDTILAVVKHSLKSIIDGADYNAFPFLKDVNLFRVKRSEELFRSLFNDISENNRGDRKRHYYIPPPEDYTDLLGIYRAKKLRPQFLTAHQTDEDSIKSAALATGPVYNRMDERGNPILGDWLKPGEFPFTRKEQHFVNAEAFVPEPGAVQFKGLTGHLTGEKKGSITLHTVTDPLRPALMLEEDFLTTLALVFVEGYRPRFSLDAVEKNKVEQPSNMHLCRKKWHPEWLGHTALGQTLYHTDRLLGDIAWYPKEVIKIVEKADAANQAIAEVAKQFMVQTRDALRQECPDDVITGALRIHSSANLFGTCDFYRIDQNINCLTIGASSAVPRVRGWYHKDEKSQKSSTYSEMYTNDSKYALGAYANTLTNNYNTLALLLPVYERFRQLQSLYWAFLTLSFAKFEIRGELKNDLEKFVAEQKAKPALSEAERNLDFSHQVRLGLQ